MRFPISYIALMIAVLAGGCAHVDPQSRAAAAPKVLTYTEEVNGFNARASAIAAKADAIDAKLAAALAAPAKPTYCAQVNAQSLATPGLKPITWAHPALYCDQPTPRPDGPHRWDSRAIPHGNLKAFARVCRDGGVVSNYMVGTATVVAGAPVVLDWEGSADPVADSALLAEYVRVFKAEAPTLKVSVNLFPGYSSPGMESWRDGLSDTEKVLLENGVQALRPISDQCDFFVGSAYLYAAEWLARDLAGYRAYNDWIRARFAKPVYVFANPRYQEERAPDFETSGKRQPAPLPRDAAVAVLGMASRYEGVVFWSEDFSYVRDVFVPLIAGGK